MSICDNSDTTDGTCTPSVKGGYEFDIARYVNVPGDLTSAERRYHEQIRRAFITALRAEDELLGRTQTIPRKER